MAKLASGGVPFTDLKLETQMGDIIVFVPEGLGVNVRATVDCGAELWNRSDLAS